MTIRFINDWQYLFNPHSIGGRFSAFTFLNLSYMKTGEPLIDGVTLIVLGLGISLKPNSSDTSKENV